MVISDDESFLISDSGTTDLLKIETTGGTNTERYSCSEPKSFKFLECVQNSCLGVNYGYSGFTFFNMSNIA